MSNHIKLDRGRSLARAGFSMLVVDSDKVPIMEDQGRRSWKRYMTERADEAELERAARDGSAWRWGYATGYGGVFVIDVDLKVLPHADQRHFWEEFISTAAGVVDQFDRRVAVFRTESGGYHLIYRLDTPPGNLKLAMIQRNSKNLALIETRGVGGYAVLYDDKTGKIDLPAISKLDQDEHEALLNVCKLWDERNLQQEAQPEPPKKGKAEFEGTTPWDDFNAQTDIWDVVGDEFTVVARLSKMTIIRRHGATSRHSGYIYHDTGRMYLFSSSTQYPSEKILTPYAAFAYKYHGGDFSAAAKDLYSQGFGDRVKSPEPVVLEAVKHDKPKTADFPIDVFPESVQRYLLSSNETLAHNIDYMGAGILWMSSVLIGNSLKLIVKTGWKECCCLWLAVVGRAGLGKTPSLNAVVFPMQEMNSREIRQYKAAKKEFDEYEKLSKADRENVPEVQRPKRSQFIVNDVTIEALVQLHEENPNAVGVFKDEIAGWVKEMNRYRAGGDLEFWLSSFSNSPAYTNRKTTSDNYIMSPVIPVLGGIQPKVLNALFTEEYRDNGFMDRLLLCFPEVEVEEWNDKEMEQTVLDWWSNYVSRFRDIVRRSRRTIAEGDANTLYLRMDESAKVELARLMNAITYRQNNEDEMESIKSVLPKIKTYIPRFAIILHAMHQYDKDRSMGEPISRDTMLRVERLVHYFSAMAEKVAIQGQQYSELIQSSADRPYLSKGERFKRMYKVNPDLNRKQAAETLAVSERMIRKWIQQIKDEKKD